MSERVYLPSEHAQGLDGMSKKYNVTRGREGMVEVSDEDAALLRKHTALKVGERFSAPAAPSVTCSGCGFQQYKALASPLCTRCSGEWEE